MKRLACCSLLLLLSAVAPVLAAETYTVDPVHSQVGFAIRHFVSTVHGRFEEFSGTIVRDDEHPENASVVFAIQAASIDTDNAKRDTHLRSADFFDVEKFPTIAFVSSIVRKTGDGRYDVTGHLTMHGVTRQVTLPVRFNGEMDDGHGGIRGGFSTSTTLDRKEFDIDWNRILDNGAVMLGDDVDVQIDLEVTRR